MASQKTVLVTGCTPGGIGHSLAKQFQLQGLRVFATARTTDKIVDLAALGIECLPLTVDDPTSVAACHTMVENLLGGKGLDFLINNAGIVKVQPAIDVDMADATDIFAVNVLAIININKTFFPQLMRAKGTIIHIGSVGGSMPYPYHSVYSASKAAVKAYCDTARLELAPFEVKMTYVQVGAVTTNVYSGLTYLKPDGPYGLVAKDVNQIFENWEGTDPGELARDLTGRVLRGHRDEIWIGANSSIIWFMTWLGNLLQLDLIGSKQYKTWGLAKVAETVKTA